MSNSRGRRGAHRFSAAERRAVYRAIDERRDVRAQFVDEPVPDDVLGRLLRAAHHAPSVGFMQPWSFLVIESTPVRERVHEAFLRANRAAAERYGRRRRASYDRLKLEGILRAPINLCVTCDPHSLRGRGLGRQTMPETALYSAVCAVQNFWLAARAEGVGVGWVSIFDADELRAALGIPAEVVPIAYLCVGYTKGFPGRPDLERTGWEKRVRLESVIHFEHYGERDARRAARLLKTAGAVRKRTIDKRSARARPAKRDSLR